MEASGIDRRIRQFDGLRGLAVVGVLAFHFINNELGVTDARALTSLEKLLQKVTYFGWAGVDLFFVLSGFLIGSILLKHRESPNFFKTFYMRRFFRIVPIYYLLLILFFAARSSVWYSPDVYIFLNDISLGYYFGFVQNFAMSHFGYFGPEALTPTWSLAVEEQFYLIIPVVVYFLKPHQLKYFIVIGLLIAPVSRYVSTNWYMKYTLLSSRVDSPIIGFMIAFFIQKESIQESMKRNRVAIWMVSLLLVSACALVYVIADIGVFNHTLIAIMFGLLLIIALNENSGFFYKLLTTGALIFIGGISYFVYLFHQLINGLLHLWILGEKIPTLNDGRAIGVTMLALVVTILGGFLSQMYFEKPLIKFGHKYVY